ncbi:MAG TPA: sensor histidine kinase [Streptosporangiaceae bacterium]|jgi:signal transduction histidine kinase|nr:sensor histidine kinase [Streptosporangiaceae bacterium]
MIKPDMPESGPRGAADRARPAGRPRPADRPWPGIRPWAGIRLWADGFARAEGARRWAFDAALAAVVTAAEVGGSHSASSWGHHPHAAPGIAAYVVLVAGGASLLARRRYPVAVLAVALASALIAVRLGAGLVWFALIVAFFNAVLVKKRAAAVASLVIGYVVSVWPPWRIGQPRHTSGGAALGLAAGLTLMLFVAELIRIRSQRAAALARSHEEELRRLASEERIRMARDLHDVVAHNISVINVQANTALHLMDRQPERARSALTTINDVSKQALIELRSVLGVLRDVDANGVAASAPRAPTPGLARLGDLVDHAAAAGLAVHVEEDGQRVPLPADIDVAAYRILQEALTNSARHSGGANATVRLGHGDDALRVEVADDGTSRPPDRPPARAEGSGHGIAGMTERAAALGGTLEAGPRPEGGFLVRAWLPLHGLSQHELSTEEGER